MEKSKYSETVQGWLDIVEENCEKDSELALKYCNDIIAYGREQKDEILSAYGYYYKGVSYYVMNDGTSFFMAITNALSCLNKEEDWELMARCYNFLGISAISKGNSAIALDYYINAVNCCKRADEDKFAATVQINIGALYLSCGNYQDAIESLQQALDYYTNNPEGHKTDDYVICIYENMAKAYLFQDKLVEAKCCFENIYAEYSEYDDKYSMVTVKCTEAMYYHVAGEEEKCDELIAEIHKATNANVPLMDMFDDYYDYCRVLLERGKDEELWHIINLMEPMIRSLGITNLMLKLLSLKIKFYRKKGQQEEYLQTASYYFELSERSQAENKIMMSNILNFRKNLEKIHREKKEVEEKNVVLKIKSETDPLTGLHNRFRLNDYSEEAFQRALEQETPLAVEILDMDYFKTYNDYYGHQKGDESIQAVAFAVKSMEEYGAFTARYGGDEFVLIYENITKEQMVEYSAILRKRVMDLNLENPNAKELIMTVSQGACWDIPVQGNRMWDYLHAADDMLYRVKQRKRNNFCVGNLTEASDQLVMSYL